MTRINWGDVNDRLYQHGLDLGVLFPKNPPIQPADNTNAIYNSSGDNGDASKWLPYGTNTTQPSSTLAGTVRWIRVQKTLAGSNLGASTAVGNGGMSVRPAGMVVTLSARVSNPVGSTITAFTLIARDDTNNDSSVLENIIAGSLTTNVPAGSTGYIFVTGTVKAGRNLERLYVTKNTGTAPLAEYFWFREAMINNGTAVPFFDGNTPDDNYSYEWAGAPYLSGSYRRLIVGSAVPWNGLTGFDEGGEQGATTLLYRDGVLYLADVDASDFNGKLTAMMYPEEFGKCIGIPKVADGLYADGQKPEQFSFAYRTLVGSGGKGDMFGYQIHLVYNCMASIAPRQRKTIGKDTAPVEFSFDISCTPVKLPGFRPTSHFIIDTRGLSPATVTTLENIIYGSATSAPRLPLPQELYDLLNFGDAMIFTVHTNKTFTVEGSNDNLFALNDYHFQMRNVNGVTTGTGTYTISDGGDTDVIIE